MSSYTQDKKWNLQQILVMQSDLSRFSLFLTGYGGYPNGGAKAPKPGKLSVVGDDWLQGHYRDKL